MLLERAYLPDGSATLGRLEVGGWYCYTLELPWRANEVARSAIPEGVYALALRESPIVRRTSGGEFSEGWEVTDVPGRTHIMFHPGNWARDTEGCILVGDSFGWTERGPMVKNSRATFIFLMSKMATRSHWDIDIRTNTVEWP